MMGFRYPTRMAVARLGDGGLRVRSPVAPAEGLREAVAGPGPVRWLAAPPAWAREIGQAVIPNAIADEVAFSHRASGTVLFCDLLQGMDRNWFTGWRGLVARLDFTTEAEPTVPGKFRLATRNRPAARAAMATVRSWPATRLVAAQAPVAEGDVARHLARAFRWLGGRGAGRAKKFAWKSIARG